MYIRLKFEKFYRRVTYIFVFFEGSRFIGSIFTGCLDSCLLGIWSSTSLVNCCPSGFLLSPISVELQRYNKSLNLISHQSRLSCLLLNKKNIVLKFFTLWYLFHYFTIPSYLHILCKLRHLCFSLEKRNKRTNRRVHAKNDQRPYYSTVIFSFSNLQSLDVIISTP